jgi:hypothetical protein
LFVVALVGESSCNNNSNNNFSAAAEQPVKYTLACNTCMKHKEKLKAIFQFQQLSILEIVE